MAVDELGGPPRPLGRAPRRACNARRRGSRRASGSTGQDPGDPDGAQGGQLAHAVRAGGDRGLDRPGRGQRRHREHGDPPAPTYELMSLGPARCYAGTLGGISAPTIQKSGMKIPTTNMTQWPFRIVMIPSVTSRTKYKIPPMTNSM